MSYNYIKQEERLESVNCCILEQGVHTGGEQEYLYSALPWIPNKQVCRSVAHLRVLHWQMARHLPRVPREALVDGQVGDVPARVVICVREIQSRAEDEGLLVHMRGARGGHSGVAAEVELLVAKEQRVVGVPAMDGVDEVE
jgi:hypothetical protein